MAGRAHGEAGGEPRRQVVSFTFYKVLPEWRRLTAEKKAEHRLEFAAVIAKWRSSEEMKVLSYSLVGTRADTDMMLWRICYSLECLQKMQAELLSTPLGGYLTTPYSYLAMTKRSQYKIGQGHESHVQGAFSRCGDHKYLQVHPFVKNRAWYQMPFEERQRIVGEYIRMSQEFPGIRLNTMYSFGIDDQEFVLALESERITDIVDGVMRLRESENAAYTLRDTPIFTCVQCTPDEMLERLG